MFSHSKPSSDTRTCWAFNLKHREEMLSFSESNLIATEEDFMSQRGWIYFDYIIIYIVCMIVCIYNRLPLFCLYNSGAMQSWLHTALSLSFLFFFFFFSILVMHAINHVFTSPHGEFIRIRLYWEKWVADCLFQMKKEWNTEWYPF